MNKGYTVERIEKPLWVVTYNGKSKTFQKGGRNIRGWVARQVMLPIFMEYDYKYGETEFDGDTDSSHYVRVWSYWAERKNFFIADMLRGGVEYAKQQLINYFENDYYHTGGKA